MSSASRIASASCTEGPRRTARGGRGWTISRKRSLTDWRLTASKELVDPVERAAPRGCPWPARLPARIRRGRSAPARERSWRECGVSGPRGARRSPAPDGRSRAPVRVVEPRVHVRQEGADAPTPTVVVQPLGQRLGLAQHAPAHAGIRRAASVPVAARDGSRRPAPESADSPAAARAHRGPDRTTPEHPEAPSARPPRHPRAGDSPRPSPTIRRGARGGRAVRSARRPIVGGTPSCGRQPAVSSTSATAR